MVSQSIVAYLLSEEAETVSIEPGEKIPESSIKHLKKYSMALPANHYEKLEKEAEKAGLTIQEKIFSKYRYATEVPDDWDLIPLT